MPGDNYLEAYNYQKSGGKCYLDKISIFSFPESCITAKEKLPTFKNSEMHGDIAWSSNEKGVTAIFKPVGTSGCEILMRQGMSK